MNPEQRQQVDGYLDGTLTEGQEAELNAWIKASPENAIAFADVVRFHDHLHGLIQTSPMEYEEPGGAEKSTPATSNGPSARWRGRVGLVGGFAALVAVVLFGLWSSNPQQARAATELNRLIEKAGETGDRTYIIRSLDPNPSPTEPRQPPIDRARLSIRPPDRYVLIRYFPDERPYVTGSDGERNWDVPPTAPVRVSRDPLRFRWPLPGHEYGIPFADLRSDLVRLRDAYTVSPLASDAAGNRGLLAVKKSPEYRGPNRVELWYDPATCVIHRMVFAGLSKSRGGPDSVAVDLLEQRDLGTDFFRHQSHHAADRRVIEED